MLIFLLKQQEMKKSTKHHTAIIYFESASTSPNSRDQKSESEKLQY
jgi:hypothetical protein